MPNLKLPGGGLAGIKTELNRNQKALEGSRFTLGLSATQVSVACFSAEEKRFPMEIRATGERFSFKVPASYTLRGAREEMHEEYYRIYSAEQSGGLAGEIVYTATNLYPGIWILRPSMARVVNLLENDEELTRTTPESGEMVISVAGTVQHGFLVI